MKVTKGDNLVKSNLEHAKFSSEEQHWVTTYENKLESKQRTKLIRTKGSSLVKSLRDSADFSSKEQHRATPYKNQQEAHQRRYLQQTSETRKKIHDRFNPKLFQQFQSEGAYRRPDGSYGCLCSDDVILGGSRTQKYTMHFSSKKHKKSKKWKNQGATPIIKHILQPQQLNM